MLNKIQGKPIWYKLWAISVALATIYYLIKFFFFEPDTSDRLIEVYALLSLLLDYLIYPKTGNTADQGRH